MHKEIFYIFKIHMRYSVNLCICTSECLECVLLKIQLSFLNFSPISRTKYKQHKQKQIKKKRCFICEILYTNLASCVEEESWTHPDV